MQSPAKNDVVIQPSRMGRASVCRPESEEAPEPRHVQTAPGQRGSLQFRQRVGDQAAPGVETEKPLRALGAPERILQHLARQPVGQHAAGEGAWLSIAKELLRRQAETELDQAAIEKRGDAAKAQRILIGQRMIQAPLHQLEHIEPA